MSSIRICHLPPAEMNGTHLCSSSSDERLTSLSCVYSAIGFLNQSPENTGNEKIEGKRDKFKVSLAISDSYVRARKREKIPDIIDSPTSYFIPRSEIDGSPRSSLDLSRPLCPLFPFFKKSSYKISSFRRFFTGFALIFCRVFF